MLTTTANLCETQLLDNLSIYVGTHIGSFKAIQIANDGSGDPHKATNLHSSSDIVKGGKVTSLDWTSADQKELYLGKENQFLKVFSVDDNVVTNNVLLSGVPVGCTTLPNGLIAAGLTNGDIQFVDVAKVHQDPDVLKTGDSMSRMRFCATSPSLVATGGKERQNNVKVWDLVTRKQLFTSKNVPPNELQLELPIWDNDMSFVTENNIATCSRHGYVRFYDMRSQRRPVTGFQSTDRDQYSFTCLHTTGMLAYVGLTVGGVQCYDLRQLKRAVHVYKAATGSISDVCIAGENGQYLVSSSLDRFLRIHSTDTNALLYQTYLQSKVTRIVCRQQKPNEENVQEQTDVANEDCLGSILDQLPIASDDAPKNSKRRRNN